MERSLNELYILVKSEYENSEVKGLCIFVFCLCFSMIEAKINQEEYSLIINDLKKNKPKGVEHGFWFTSREERIEFLNKMIALTCEHKNIKREDGLEECLDCGTKNY